MNTGTKFLVTPLLAMSLALGSCSGTKDQNNQLTDQEIKAGWKLLFDGKTTDGWHLYNRGHVPSAWIVVDDALYCKPDGKLEHGDLISDKDYENFDLQFEWKIIRYGNSGVFIDVVEDTAIRTAWASGPEYQLLDSSNPDYANPLKRSGALFGLYPQLNPAALKPFGEWNQSRIVQSNGKIAFFLNGVQTLNLDLRSAAWADTVAKSNFQKFPEFGKHTKGKIGLQDWSKGVSFRNMKIKEI
ncbi:MAG TPA: DUF1080 domain-containing protein [Puia sp.]|nr:DUF1080 domain-containing protein [Puia sp.]